MKRLISLLILSLLFAVSLACAQKQADNFLVIADIHLDKSSTHTMETNPSKQDKENDLDVKTFRNYLTTIQQQILAGSIAKPKFILVLGDIVGHMRSSPTSVADSETEVFTQLQNHLGGTPIFYIFGNNDSIDNNYSSFMSKTTQQSPYTIAKNSGWLNGFLSTGTNCNENKFPCLAEENATDGYYSAYLQPKLKLVVLNSVMFAPRRTQISDQDIQNQFNWFASQLKSAQDNNESVLIAMHIPLGNNVYDDSAFFVTQDNADFLKLVNTYQKTIIGILTSHTHAEEIKVIRNADKTTAAPVIFTAGLSTSHGNAPSIKTFYFANHHDHWALSNYEAFRFTENNLTFDKLYDYNNYYCAPSQYKHDSLSDCLENFSAEKMKKFYSAGNPNFKGDFQFDEDVFIKAS